MKSVIFLFLLINLISLVQAGDIPPGEITFAEFQALWQEAKWDTSHGLAIHWEQMIRTADNGLDSGIVFSGSRRAADSLMTLQESAWWKENQQIIDRETSRFSGK
jgi:hypothetical protein